MALVLNDRVKETTTTTGTGAIALGGAVSSFETFGAGVGNSNTTYYAIVHQTANEFEVGLGTLDGTSANLTRTTVISSSNSDAAVNFSAGTKDVFCTFPASKAVFKDASDNTNFADDEKIVFGAGTDLEVFHDSSGSGTDNIIQTPNVSHNLRLKSDTILLQSRGGTSLASFTNGGGMTLNGAYTMPSADGSANQVLQTDGAGSVSFATASGVSAGFVIAMSVAL
jgi:hypothetical protein